MKNLLAIIFISFALTSCLATKTWKTPTPNDLNNFQAAGAHRSTIEKKIGRPFKVDKRDYYEIVYYKVMLDNESNKYRSVLHGALSAASLFIWEFVGPYSEDMFKEERIFVAYYDRQGKLVQSELKTPAPKQIKR